MDEGCPASEPSWVRAEQPNFDWKLAFRVRRLLNYAQDKALVRAGLMVKDCWCA